MGGRGRFGHEHGDVIVSEGDIVLLAPKTPNDYGLEDSLQKWDLLWAYFSPPSNWRVLMKWPEEAPGILKLRLPEGNHRTKIVGQFLEAHQLNRGPRRHREMFAMNAIERTLLWCDEINPQCKYASMDPRILLAMNYLCENMSGDVTIASLATRCGMSVSRLSHVFREQVGRPPHQFLELQRITYARQLLEVTKESVANIADEVGFPDQFHFSRRFKHFTGVSPRSYREKMRVSSV